MERNIIKNYYFSWTWFWSFLSFSLQVVFILAQVIWKLMEFMYFIKIQSQDFISCIAKVEMEIC